MRCPWCLSFQAYIEYHDTEWGVPVYDDGVQFEFLVLESAQAGLSWATINNAERFIEIQREFGSFSNYIWGFVGGKPIINRWETMSEVPATSPESDALAKDLKKRGFKFLGSTVMYAHKQATGLVNDHLMGCFRREKLM